MRAFSELNKVKVFKSLLVLSLLETILWSFCLLSSASGAASTEVAQAYYVRETVNLKSCVFAGCNVPRISLPLSAAAALVVAIREESRSQQLFYQQEQDNQAADPSPGDRQPKFVVFPVLFGQDSGSGGDEPAASLAF